MVSKTVKCRACGKEIARSAKRCPGCGGMHIDPLALVVGLVAAVLIGAAAMRLIW